MMNDELLAHLRTGSILGDVCLVTHEVRLDEESEASRAGKAAFFDTLIQYQRNLARNQKPTVSRQAIRLWQKGSVPERLTAMDFLHGYLGWFRTRKEAQNWDEERRKAYAQIEQILRGTRSETKTNDPIESARKSSPLDPLVQLAMQALMQASSRSERTESSAFFRGTRSDHQLDQSYYLVYRYSTNNGAILKSFLVIQKPIKQVRDIHVFNHFVWGGVGEPYLSHVFRECEGFILKLQKSFYLLGYNYTVPADKRRQPDLYKMERMTAKWTPNGMGVIAIEYDEIFRSPGLFGALTMTVAGMSQPVISRLAMLHLGTSHDLGRQLSDHDVAPSELPADKLGQDLQATLDRLREIGCRRFGMVVEDIIHSKSKDQNSGKHLSEHILQMIDNSPAWEKQRAKGTGARARQQARGAIESFGEGRPRD